MTKLTEERIKELAEQMPEGFLWYEGCRHETGIVLREAVDFARAIEAELQPVCRLNVENTERGVRICRGNHERSEACQWEYFVREELQPVQGPVAWNGGKCGRKWTTDPKVAAQWLKTDTQQAVPLYTAPPDQTAEIERLKECNKDMGDYGNELIARIATLEAALRDAKLAIENELTPCGCFQGCEFCNGKMQPEEALATINKALGEE